MLTLFILFHFCGLVLAHQHAGCNDDGFQAILANATITCPAQTAQSGNSPTCGDIEKILTCIGSEIVNEVNLAMCMRLVQKTLKSYAAGSILMNCDITFLGEPFSQGNCSLTSLGIQTYLSCLAQDISIDINKGLKIDSDMDFETVCKNIKKDPSVKEFGTAKSQCADEVVESQACTNPAPFLDIFKGFISPIENALNVLHIICDKRADNAKCQNLNNIIKEGVKCFKDQPQETKCVSAQATKECLEDKLEYCPSPLAFIEMLRSDTIAPGSNAANPPEGDMPKPGEILNSQLKECNIAILDLPTDGAESGMRVCWIAVLLVLLTSLFLH